MVLSMVLRKGLSKVCCIHPTVKRGHGGAEGNERASRKVHDGVAFETYFMCNTAKAH